MKLKRFGLMLCMLAAAMALLTLSARAQDYYGEGNVLVAVDMARYRVNDAVSYPEGTMGTLVWGEDAPEGESTRPEFNNRAYTVPENITPPAAQDYDIETTYSVGQKLLFPYSRSDDPYYMGYGRLELDNFPEEVRSRGFLISRNAVFEYPVSGKTYYYFEYARAEDGEVYPCMDFLEIECVAVTERVTVWQYTGVAYSNRPSFDIADYMGAVELTETEIEYFTNICDESYETQARLFGDPHCEDLLGDRDGKAAYVALDLSVVRPEAEAYYWSADTDYRGFDCLVIGAQNLPGRTINSVVQNTEDKFTGTLIHEMNHYILNGCITHGSNGWSMWLGEAFANYAVTSVAPENTFYLSNKAYITNECPRMRMVPGMNWAYDGSYDHQPFDKIPYTLGPYFLSYIERETTGCTDGRFWTQYFAQQQPQHSITAAYIDGYLRQVTGESLEAWLAQFMAEVVRAADFAVLTEEKVLPEEYYLDPFTFFRSYEEYGEALGSIELGAADSVIVKRATRDYGFTAAEGGGTTYAYRNDAGGKIAITGADDRWYFFSFDLDLPEPRVIEISSAEELAKIGNDPGYLMSGSYLLTADIDLGGEERPWTPIGMNLETFFGEFDGGGHTVSGLYVNAPGNDKQGMFGSTSGDVVIRDLTVRGAVTGKANVGGIVGQNYGGKIIGCTSYVAVSAEENSGGIVGYHFAGRMENCTGAGEVTGDKVCGGLIGFGSWPEIVNCSSTGAVSGGSDCGGIMGYNDGSKIIGCRNSGSVNGRVCVGGIVGFDREYGTVRECWQSGVVTGEKRVGGIVGYLNENVLLTDCYSVGVATGTDLVGGVVGIVENSKARNCYSWQGGLPAVGGIKDMEGGVQSEVTACFALSDSGEAGALSAAEFRRIESFPGWDFEGVWDLSNGVRPVLRNNMESIRRPGAGHVYVPAAPEKEQKTETGYDAVDPAKGGSLGNFKAANTYADGIFSDVGSGDWFEENIRAAVNYGLLLGYGDGSFGVGESLKTGEALVIAARLHNMYFGGSGKFEQGKDGEWFAVYAEYAEKYGFLEKNMRDMNGAITRGQFAAIISAALPDEALRAVNEVEAIPDVAPDDPDCAAILRLYRAGVLTGVDAKGSFHPDAPITREQIAAVVTRVADPELRKSAES